jgi:LAO/AO transport system kinase
LQENGLKEAWNEVKTLTDWRREQGFWQRTRAAQARYWFEQAVKHALLAQLDAPKAKAALKALSDRVAQGAEDPTKAAQDFVMQLDR